MKIRLHVILFVLALPFSSFAQTEYSLSEKVKSLLRGAVPLASNEDIRTWKGATLLDAREQSEFDVSHLPEAIYVGDKKFKMSSVESLSKTDTIIVYCTIGYRSEGIGEKLKSAGYVNVFNLFGGIFSWKNSGGKVVDSSGTETERVHTYNESWSIFLLEGKKVY
jgi:rhodanese-related sulfurtransferase